MPKTVSIVGNSGSGKTTLIEKLLPELKRRGYRIGTIKHAAHMIDIDKKGKDSWRHRVAGADTVALAAPQTIALIKTVPEVTLDHLEHFFQDVDIVIIEGYKSQDRPKIEVFRTAAHEKPLCMDDPNLIAMVTDLTEDLSVPKFGLEEIVKLADFIEAKFIAMRVSAAGT